MGTTGNDCISEAAGSRHAVPMAEHGRDLVRGLAGFGEPVPAALRIISSGSSPKVSLFYRRLIVIYLEHPICNFTGKQRLVRELP